MALSFFQAMIKARLRLLLGDERVDADELAHVLASSLEGVDLSRNGDHDGDERNSLTPEPVALTPLERLEYTPGVILSRDFRAAGKGAAFDRVRDYDTKIYGWPKNKERGQSRGVLPWASVSTIVIHTTGVDGLHPDRFLGIPAHTGVANDASVVLMHELNTYLFASHAANRYSCSMEIAGDRSMKAAQIGPARALLRYMVEELRRRRPLDDNGEPLPVYVAPHRFSHKSRTKDPDTQIWRVVGEWGMDELGLLLGPVVGSGKPLPF